MSPREFLGELMIAVVVAILLLSLVGIAGSSCGHNSPAQESRGVDFLGAPESA
jgi:hypothetical protein